MEAFGEGDGEGGEGAEGVEAVRGFLFLLVFPTYVFLLSSFFTSRNKEEGRREKDEHEPWVKSFFHVGLYRS